MTHIFSRRNALGTAVIGVLCSTCQCVLAQEQTPPPAPESARVEIGTTPPPSQQAGWYGDYLKQKQDIRDKYGLEISLNLDTTARAAVAGPETLERAIQRYDLVLREHFTDDTMVSMDVRGGWGKGLDPYIGTFANTDQYAQAGEQIFILHLYFQQQLAEDQVTLRIGKFDIGDWIDTNRFGYYNFVGYSFAHNSAIPLPGNTLGAMASWEPKDLDWFYISGGVSNTAQTPYEAGFNTLDDATWLSIGEVGFKPRFADRDGVYRFIMYHDTRNFTSTNGDDYSSALGYVISFDQDLTKKLGAFFRFGVEEGQPKEPKRYYSGGIHIKEPLPGRKNDTLALGIVVNEFTDAYTDSVTSSKATENYVELYYNWVIQPWAQLQPVFQIVQNPGGTDRDTAVIVGAHLALRF